MEEKMEEKKKMIINCDICDARNVTEETLAEYESIVINADTILMSERTKELLNRYPVQMNMDSAVELDSDANLVIQNGNYEISAETAPAVSTALMVNGNLKIDEKAKEALNQYVLIQVNGRVLYPKSLGAYLRNLHVNGETIAYPDGSIMLKKITVLDKYFPLRAKEHALYYVPKCVVLTDAELNVAKLVEKDVHFETKKLIVTENYVEGAISMFPENAELLVLPEGCAYVPDDAELNERLLKRYGNKLYIDGKLNLEEESTPLIERIEYLYVEGKIEALRGQIPLLEEKAHIHCEKFEARVGKKLENCVCVTIDAAMFANNPDGLSVENCAAVVIKEDTALEDIMEKLSIRNCASVQCYAKQKAAVQMVCSNVASIKAVDEEMTNGEGDGIDKIVKNLMKNPLSALSERKNIKIVNADKYVL
ncbi:MAG: hypothetical protein Q4E24_00630 [bacterium]|nr:hypothetical protein [bacterium]